MTNQESHGGGSDDPDGIYRAPESDTSFAPGGDLLSVFVGPKYAEYYERHFERFKNTGGAVSWNWPAFLIASVWLLYRKMWLLALLYWLVLPLSLMFISGVVAAAVGPLASVYFYYGTSILISFVLMPMFANRFYYRHAQKKIDKVTAATTSPEQQSIEVARAGGTSSIALAVVPFILVFVIGVLAAIAIPAYQDYTIRAQVSEGLNLSGSAKAAVQEYYLDIGSFPDNNQMAGLSQPAEITGNYVSSVAVIGGVVTVTYGNQSHEVLNGKTLLMSPAIQQDGALTWGCRSEAIEPKHLPAACR